MSNIKCPVCNSENVEKVVLEDIGQLTLGEEFKFNVEKYHCNSCGEEGDFALKNDLALTAAEKAAEKRLVSFLIEDLSKNKNISMAYFERAFELPQRTLNRWKSGDFSSTSVALLRSVYTCPWLVDIAEHKFEKSHAMKTLVRESVNALGGRLLGAHEDGANLTVSAWSSPNEAGATVVYSRPSSPHVEGSSSPTGFKIAVGG